MSPLSSYPSPCPNDGQFNACSGLSGCCTIESCDGGDGCPYIDLEPASFNATSSGEEACRVDSEWVGCDYRTPSCICCKSHPWSDGSPPKNLTQGKLAINSSGVGYFPFDTIEVWTSSPMFPSPASVPTSTKEVNTLTSISVTESLSAATTAPQPGQTIRPVPTPSTATIAGGVTGGVVGLALLVALLAICCRRRTTRQQQHTNEEKSPTWSSGRSRVIQPDAAELDEIKQGQSPPSSPSPLPPPPPSPLLQTSPLLPPPAYTAYRLHGDQLDRSPDPSQRSDSSLYSSHDLPSPELPPSPPPLRTRLSQDSADRYSDEQSVSPISSHYQHQQFRENAGPESSMYSEVSSSELLRIHSMRHDTGQ